jgi:GNAT superfamily N-acetyltransferase
VQLGHRHQHSRQPVIAVVSRLVEHEGDRGVVTVVAPIQPGDLEAFATLAEEMDRFYGTKDFDPLDVRLRQIEDALFGDPPLAYALIAWTDEQPVGFATYSFLWPAIGFTRSLFLKELYVIETARRAGVGKAIMQSLAEIAVKTDCSRFEWQTDTPNTRHIAAHVRAHAQTSRSAAATSATA